jgi:hypothetical protein
VKRAVVSACMRAREHQSRRGIDVGDSDETRCVPDSGRGRDGGGQHPRASRAVSGARYQAG